MTIRECIDKCDRLRPNAIDDMEKVEWLEELDRNLYTEFFSKFTTKQDFTEYGDDTGATLLVMMRLQAYMYIMCLHKLIFIWRKLTGITTTC